MWIDVTIILVLCISSAFGFKRGMLISLFSIMTFFLSIYLTYLILPYATNFLIETLSIDKLQSTLVENNSILNSFINSDNLLLQFVKNLLHINETNMMTTVVEFICNTVMFILLTFIIRKILSFACKKLSLFIKKIFILGSFDRLCGLLFGFLKGIVFISIICFVINGLSEFDAFAPIFNTQIEMSSLFPVFKNGTSYIISTFVGLFG